MPPACASRSACSPIHVTMRSGSVKNANTSTGVASMKTSAVTSAGTTGPGLYRRLQTTQPSRPERGHERLDADRPFGPRPVQPACSRRRDLDEAGVAQDMEMLRDG